jgi:hypothetical protein
MALQK